MPSPTAEGPATTPPVFTSRAEQDVAREAYRAMQEISRDVQVVPNAQALQTPEVQRRLVERVQAKLPSVQTTLLDGAVQPPPDVAHIVARTAELLVAGTISIPRILVVPEGEARRDFQPFTLDLRNVDYPPPSKTMVVRNLNDNTQEWIQALPGEQVAERHLEDFVVRALLLNPEISYDENADTLYHLAGQVVAHFRGKPHEDDTVREILMANERELARVLFGQMEQHQTRGQVQYIHVVRQGFTELRDSTLTAAPGGLLTDPNKKPPVGVRIESCVYTGFHRSLYTAVKFQSDPERILALILDAEAQKWFRPVRGQFRMSYRVGHRVSEYQPDFVAETDGEILMLEVKAANEQDDPEVLEKARVAREWCEAASRHAAQYGGKPWRYAVIPHTSIALNQSLAHLTRP